MPSPIVKINNASIPSGGYATTYGAASITVSLADAAGVTAWSLTCIGTDSDHSATTINANISINHGLKTATVALPTDTDFALIFRSTVNGGVNSSGQLDSSLSTTFKVYLQVAYNIPLIAVGETTEGSTEFGWIKIINEVIKRV